MASSATDPGSSSWRARFLLHRKKSAPLMLRVHDSLRDVEFYYHFCNEDSVRHFVSQLRAGYTDVAPDGILLPKPRAGV